MIKRIARKLRVLHRRHRPKSLEHEYASLVDANWYLAQYPDVAKAGANARDHYARFGVLEGRLPTSESYLLIQHGNSLPALELKLWHGYAGQALGELARVGIDTDAHWRIRCRSLQAQADWYFCQGQVEAARWKLEQALVLVEQNQVPGNLISGLCRCYDILAEAEAKQALLKAYINHLRPLDVPFATDQINQLLMRYSLQALPTVNNFNELADKSSLAIPSPHDNQHLPLVSVIVPVYNAGPGLRVAVNSLRAQSYTKLEIILVDDASTDESAALMQALAAEDSRIRLLYNELNLGAYATRNMGMRAANGDLVTVHDSDDWSHPQKIERQADVLQQNPQVMYSMSYWVRVLPDLRILGSWMLSSPYLQLNHSSVMYRRAVIERCGLWDEVRVAGDTEYLRRVHKVFGPGLEVLPEVPLSLSLVHPDSLTQTKATHVSTIFFGLRRLYREATQWRHKYLPVDSSARNQTPNPLGNISQPSNDFNTLLVADFSVMTEALKAMLCANDDLVLLHWPDTAARCMEPIADEVWEHCHSHNLQFAHPGLTLNVSRIVMFNPDALGERPDALPQVNLREGGWVEFAKPAEKRLVTDTMIISLLACGGQLTNLQELFDADYYLTNQKDVAKAGIEPLTHYLRFGIHEGRQGFANPAHELEKQLWAGADVAEELDLLACSDENFVVAAYASWALARWHAANEDWFQVLKYCQLHQQNPGQLLAPGHRGPWLVYVMAKLALIKQGQLSEADVENWMGLQLQQQGNEPNVLLAAASLASLREQGRRQRAYLQQLWQRLDFNLLVPEHIEDKCLSFDDLPDFMPADISERQADKLQRKKKPLVSVIIPCFNSAKTLPTALKSLLAQSWFYFEVIIVDDASDDTSVQVARAFEGAFAARDVNFQVLEQTVNQGAYAARNRGLSVVRGEFITTHDADDWSHPQKLARQAEALLKNKNKIASISHWVRADDALRFGHWRPESSWVQRNVSSLMFRRKVHQQLGFWDRVSVAGDTEFYYRLVSAYGLRSIIEVLPGTPLAIGRHVASSLTRQSATHIRSQYAGVRYDYQLAADRWHAQAGSVNDLYLAAEPEQRPFDAPPLMQRPSPIQIANESFDVDWYLAQYPDVKKAGVDPKRHFIRWGMAEGRIPGPKLPVHQISEHQGLAWHEGAPVYLLFAHQVTANVFGAERSLLDVVESLQALGRNVVVVVPADVRHYTTRLCTIAQQIHVQPYTWWHSERRVSQAVVDACTRLIERYQPIAVYVNTLTLYEPLLAAKACEVSCWVHVRELAEGDAALCQQLGTDAEGVRAHALAHADGLIANSQVVADFLNSAEKTVVIPNQLSLAAYSAIASETGGSSIDSKALPMRVGMLSSNIAKKGLADVVDVAKKLASSDAEIVFQLYGPETSLVEELTRTGLPVNLEFMGYANDPVEALAGLDVVLNLSHFQESFGRTVLEAMAAGRVVVCYDWGALSELVTADAGIKVPYQDTQAVADALCELAHAPALRAELAQGAKARAQDFSKERVRALWLDWITQVE